MSSPEQDPTPHQRYREYIVLVLVVVFLTLILFRYCGPFIRDGLFSSP